MNLLGFNGHAWRRGSDRLNMAGGERAVQRETVKTLYQSHWLVSTPRLLGLPPSTAVESRTSEQPTMTIERPMFPPREIETYEPFATPDAFCEALVRIERIGSCRRPVFAVSDPHAPCGPAHAVVAKLIVPAELMAELAQMIAADRPEPGAAFARLPVDAVAH